jgi:integrase
MAKQRLTDRSLQKPAPAAGQIELWDDVVSGFGLRIAAGGSRTYFVMKRLHGRLARRTVGKVPVGVVPNEARGEVSLTQARKRARDMILQMDCGVDPSPKAALAKAATANPSTFGEVAAAYMADPSKRGGGALRSKGELERKVRVDLAGWIDRPVGEITRADVRALINTKHATSPVAANRLLALVRRIFRWAVRDDLITANPAADIDRPAQEEERDRVLTLAELRRIWVCTDALGHPYGQLIKLLMLTAQRRNEVAGLHWSEIEGNSWKLPDARAKRGKGHLVPLSPRAVAILEELPRIGDSKLVFTTGRRGAKKGEKVDTKALPVPVSGWSRVKDRIDRLIAEARAKELNEPVDLGRHGLAHWTLHDIRRSVATHLRDCEAMGGDRVERLTVSKILNHAEGGMTRIYDRYSADPEKRFALEAWALVIERQFGLNVIPMQCRA